MDHFKSKKILTAYQCIFSVNFANKRLKLA